MKLILYCFLIIIQVVDSCDGNFEGNNCDRCITGFVGDNCDVNFDDCSPNPCLNGGKCYDEVNGFTCMCENNYFGNRCQVHPIGNECAHRGTFVDLSVEGIRNSEILPYCSESIKTNCIVKN